VKRVKDRDVSSDRRTRLVVSELKTPKSRRPLVLTPELVSRFRQHRVQRAKAQMAAGPLWQDHGLIFASEAGTPMDPDNFSHSFARLCERAGLGHRHPHELRHSGASLMLAQGTPLHVVSEVLGHASIAITKDVYGHLLEGDKLAAAESMSRALFGG
jgi:integrase